MSYQATRYLSREETQEIACPQCGTPAGQPCFPPEGRRTRGRNHATRVNAAALALNIRLPHQRTKTKL